MSKYDTCVAPLPDVEIIGGDTTPWEIVITDADGSAYSGDDLSSATCVLSIAPFKVTTSIGYDAPAVTPTVLISGTVTVDDSGPYMTFTPTREQTLNLRGKFLYQITLKNGSDYRHGQGYLMIRQNADRT